MNYRDLALSVLAPEDPVASRAVDRARARHPELSEQALVGRLAGQAAWRAAAVGGAACAAMEVLGRTVAAADLSYQSASLYRLAASIARARGRETTVGQRAVAAGASFVFAGAAELARRGASASSRRLLGRRTPGLAVLAAALAGGAAQYAAARVFARAWDDLLEGRRPGGLWRR